MIWRFEFPTFDVVLGQGLIAIPVKCSEIIWATELMQHMREGTNVKVVPFTSFTLFEKKQYLLVTSFYNAVSLTMDPGRSLPHPAFVPNTSKYMHLFIWNHMKSIFGWVTVNIIEHHWTMLNHQFSLVKASGSIRFLSDVAFSHRPADAP